MNVPSRRQPPTVRLRRLAAELRSLRGAAGLTRDEVSEHTNINPATLYRIETAKVRPQRRTLLALLDKYEVTDEARRAELVALSRDSTQLGWLQDYESVLPEQYTAFVSFEAEARTVRNYESLFVPGLLQTEDYARAVVAGVQPSLRDDEVERRVETRMRRQNLIRKTSPLDLWAVIDEAVLRREVGGVKVMSGQLQWLADAASEPHITLQVVPFRLGAHSGMHGSFIIMDFPDSADPALVYLESLTADVFLERDADVYRYATIFEHLRAAALSPTDSVHLIREVARTIQAGGGV
jgi:transcriptional regulator with XRE-family HTH domain